MLPIRIEGKSSRRTSHAERVMGRLTFADIPFYSLLSRFADSSSPFGERKA